MNVVNLTCACGEVSLLLSETNLRSGIRYMCHCDDCQAFAHFVGRADIILDSNGGTDAYQLPATRLSFKRGLDRLSCLQMTRHRLTRWHCAGCGTPVANTYGTSKLSFLSAPLCALPIGLRDQRFGASSGHVWTIFGQGNLANVKQVNIPAMLWRMAARMLTARLSGDHSNNPLFDRSTGKPIRPPCRLTSSERDELDRNILAKKT